MPKLLDAGVGLLAVTCGADGALVANCEGMQRVPAFAIDVVDTTGCSDAFSAGFVYATSIGRAPRGGRRIRQEPTGPGIVRKVPA